MSNFNDLGVGDCVVLNSGGPQMTVEALLPGGEKAECVWFHPTAPWATDVGTEIAYSQDLQRAAFPAAAITKKKAA
jgi:uncharacterized protein YodC (DUF2158 family)